MLIKWTNKQNTCSAILFLRILFLSRILIATASLVCVLRANFTFAKLPSPRVRPSSYIPTRVPDIPIPPPPPLMPPRSSPSSFLDSLFVCLGDFSFFVFFWGDLIWIWLEFLEFKKRGKKLEGWERRWGPPYNWEILISSQHINK